MEALMERIRSRVDLSKTLLDTAKTVRIGLADKRHSLDIEVGILGGLNLLGESGVEFRFYILIFTEWTLECKLNRYLPKFLNQVIFSFT